MNIFNQHDLELAQLLMDSLNADYSQRKLGKLTVEFASIIHEFNHRNRQNAKAHDLEFVAAEAIKRVGKMEKMK